MTKEDLILKICYNTGMDKKYVRQVVNSFMYRVRESLEENGENVYLRGFGTFCIEHRKAKIARNISKNTQIKIPEHNIPKFKPCKEFKDNVKKKVS